MLQNSLMKRVALMLLVTGVVLGGWAFAQRVLGSAQGNLPKILVTWVAEVAGEERLYYSILDDAGNTLVESRIGLAGTASTVNFRICGVHWTGRRWIVIVDDGEIRSQRGMIKVVINPDGTSGWFGISSTFDFIGDALTHQVDGIGTSGNCR